VPTLVPEPAREVTCPGCGRRRIVSSRHARRLPETCKLCRNRSDARPTNRDFLFWLEIFSDEEIVEIAEAIHGGEGDEATCHAFREALLERGAMVAA
jgi:hypothetical protein